MSMYFKIIKDNGFVKDFILSFSEVKKLVENDEIYNFIYYEISNQSLRKLKILSLNDIEVKRRLKTLQNILKDTRFVITYDEKPSFTYYKTSHYGYGTFSYSFSYRCIEIISKSKEKSNTKNTSLKNRFAGKICKNVDFHKIKNNYKVR